VWGLGLLIGLILITSPMLAQTGRGVIRGVIQDPNGGVVPGADVKLTQVGTNVVRTGVSNEVGVYYFGALPTGKYQVMVQMPGFADWNGEVELGAGATVTVNVNLAVGQVSTVVEVTGAAVQEVTNDRMEVADVKDFNRIQQLPLNGRQIATLFNLTPGVEGGGNARVVGQKVGSLEITLDGISLVDRFGGGISRVQPGLDTVQEFRIETVGSDARYSRPSTVTLATRSGTNEFHGSVFETHRNNGAGLRTRRREEATGDAAQLIRNEFGVTAGGPVWLGSLYDGRDKTFWFFSYEGLRQRQSSLTMGRSVPTEAMWNGDLSNLIDDSGTLTVLYDPMTTDANGARLPFPGNIIPSDRISPFARTLSQLTARPLDPSKNPVLEENFYKFYPRITTTNLYTVKVDQTLGEDNLSVRYTRTTQNYSQQGGVYGNPSSPEAGLGTSRSDATVTNVAVNYAKVFSPELLSELLVGVHRSYKSSGTLADFTDYAGELGLPNPFGVTGWPSLYASGAYPWGYWDSDNRKDEALTGVVAEDNVTWVKGNHVMQFGGKFRRELNNVRELQQAQGSHSFGGSYTALYDPASDSAFSYTGNGFADALLGLGDYFSNQYNRGFFYFQQNEIGLYFNDKWKVSPKLTLSLGLRWDAWTPYKEKYDRLAAVDPNNFADVFQVITPGSTDIYSIQGIPPAVLDSWAARGLSYTTADAVGFPSALFSSDYNNFGPRLALAYELNDKTVIKGGYGEYFWTMPLSQILQTSRTQPPLNLRFTTEPGWKNDSGNWTLVNAPGTVDFLPNVTVPIEGIVSMPISARSGVAWDGRNWGDARAQTWHATVEREVMKDTVLRMTYTGNHSSNLETRFTLNSREAEYNYVARTGQAPPGNRDLLRPNPDWGLTGMSRQGFANTHSAQAEVEKRFSDGYGFQFFYVFTRSLSNTDAGGFTSGNSSINSGAGGGQIPELANFFQYDNPLGIAPITSMSADQLARTVYFNSTNIPPHRIRYNGIVDLPFGKGKRWGGDASGALNQVIGGWQMAFIGDWNGGFWQGLSSSLFMFQDPLLNKDQRIEMTIFGQRQLLWFRGDFSPSQATATTGDLEALVPSDRSQRAVHPAGANYDNRFPQTLADGTVRQTGIGELYNPTPRAFIMGPGAWNLDFSIFKNFTFAEDYRLRFTADFFNMFNHPNMVNPSNSQGLINLGRQSNEPRTIQFSLRFDW